MIIPHCRWICSRPGGFIIVIAPIWREKDHLMGIIIRVKSKYAVRLVSQIYDLRWLLYTVILRKLQSLRLLDEVRLIIVNNEGFILLHINAGLHWLFNTGSLIDPACGLQNLEFILQVLDLLKHCLLLFLVMSLTVLHKIQYLVHSRPNPGQHLWVLLIYIHSRPLNRDQPVNYHPHAVLLVLESIHHCVLDSINPSMILSLRLI